MKDPVLKKTVLRFGLVSAAVAIAMMLTTVFLLDTLGYQKTDILGYSAIVVSALLVFFGIRSYREQAGRLSFSRGFLAGLLITLVSSLCHAVAFQVVYFQVAPEFGDKFAACMVERAHDSGADAQEIERTTRQAQTLKQLFDQPLTNAAITFAQPLPIGLAAAAVSAAILRSREAR